MRARKVVLTVSGLLALLVAVYVPASALFIPAASPVTSVGGDATPASSLASLPAYSPADVWVNYTSNGTDGQSGVFWTELWYESVHTPRWTQYAPPWNPSGEWTGFPATGGRQEQTGSILFDTHFAGGEDAYNFTTVSVDRGYLREAGPPSCAPAAACARKAHTTVDTHAPVLFVAHPTPSSWTNSESLQWSAVDEVSGVGSVIVSVDQRSPQSFADASGSMNMSLGTQGAHTVTVTAADRAGNAITVPIPFQYDTHAPSLQITSPAADRWLNTPEVNVEWTLSDPAGITDLELRVDSGPAAVLPAGTTAYGLPSLSERGHVVSLLAVDAAGNIATETVAFGIDATPPSLQILTPVSGTFSNAHQLQALWMGSDIGSGIDHYEVSLDRGSPVSLSNTAGYVFPSIAEGEHGVAVTAFDRAGNRAEANSSVQVDYTAPGVVISAPAAGATVYGAPSVNWTATDLGSGIARVVVVTDGASQTASTTQATAPLPASLRLGPHAVTVQVWDQAGNMNEATIAFTYGGLVPPAPSGSGLPAFDFLFIMAVIVAVAIGSAYYAVRRRRRLKT